MVIRTDTLECVYYNKCQNLNFLQMHFWDFTFASQFWSITYLDFFGVHKCTIRALWTDIWSFYWILCQNTPNAQTKFSHFPGWKRSIFKVSIFALFSVSEMLLFQAGDVFNLLTSVGQMFSFLHPIWSSHLPQTHGRANKLQSSSCPLPFPDCLFPSPHIGSKNSSIIRLPPRWCSLKQHHSACLCS